jgi:hypothetical protein
MMTISSSLLYDILCNTLSNQTQGRSAKLVLEPIFEADLEENAYGCRPRRSTTNADRVESRVNRIPLRPAPR